MAQLSENNTLSNQLLATLFIQLAQMESAGIPATKIISLLENTDTTLNKRLVRMQHLLSSGISISDAGYKAGIFNKTQKAIISAAENSGKLAAVYKQFATYYADKHSRLKKIRSRLYLPALTLLLALLIKPIPLLVNSDITLLTYLSLSLGRFFLIAVLLFVAYKLPVWFKSVFHSLQLQLPMVANWVIKRQINEFLLLLATMLDAGLTFAEALPLAVSTVKNSILSKRFDGAIQASHSGDSVTNILSKVNDISSTTLQIIHTGEESGKLADAILHFANNQAEMIHLQDDSLAEWLPRFFYMSVALWMAASLLGF